MKGTYKKRIAGMTAIALMAGLLGGCGKAPDGGVNPGTSKSQEAKESDGSSGPQGEKPQPQSGSGALGRYGETEVRLPEETEEQSLVRFLWGKSGNLELYTIDWDQVTGEVGEAFRYEYKDGSWEKEDPWAGNQALKDRDIDLSCVSYGRDGNYYVGGTDEDYRYHFFKLEEDNSATELLEEVFQPEEGQDYGLLPARFEIMENGNILVFGYSEVQLYEPDGKKLLSMTKDFSGSTGDVRGFCEGNEFVTILDENIVRYDLSNGEITETIRLGEVLGNRNDMVLFSDGAGGIFCANETGLSHINKGGTLWEVMIDGSLNHMGMRSLYLREFLPGKEGDYYGIFNSEGGSGKSLYHYQYDPELTAVPPPGLTVYSLQDQSTVRQAVAVFQSLHPEIKVELRTAVEGEGTATQEMIQGLNTELLSGKGADVLILDGLPVESYIEKGVLTDISDIVEELEGSGEMFDNFLEGFRKEDGGIYEVPARVAFPLLMGEEDALKAYFNLRSMTEYQGEKPLMGISNYGNLLRKIGYLCCEELFGGDTAVKDRAVMIRYLESVKTIGEACGAKTLFSQEEMEEKWVSNHVWNIGIVDSATMYDAGKCDSGIAYLDGFWSVCIPMEVRRRQPECRISPAGKIYVPSAMAGINRSTANADMAKEFILCLLSYDVQKEELYDGFPVNRKAMDTLVANGKDGYSVGTGYPNSDYHLSAGWPNLEERREVMGMLENLTVPAVVDETIMTMIEEGSKSYFDGNESVEEAADRILRKLAIYLAE